MDHDYRKKGEILEHLRKMILKYMPAPGNLETKVPGFHLHRRDSDLHTQKCLEKPLASLMIQGHKSIILGPDEYIINRGDCLVVAVDMPSSSVLLDATRTNPFLGMSFDLDRKILADLLVQIPAKQNGTIRDIHGVSVMAADAQFMDAFFRLAMLMENPDQINILGPLILRELHYLLLTGPQGSFLRELYMQGARNNQIIEVISWLKNNLSKPVRIEDLAKHAHMSVSSLHRHFKGITGMSPLQYHKQLRLYEAQRLMLAENERAASAALSVGYESVTQFNREYKRMFGQPPHRDINRRRGGQPC